jgi:hypothetical protein
MTGCVCQAGEARVTPKVFLEGYAQYIAALKEGLLPDEQPLRRLFSSVLTLSPDVLYAIPLEGGRQILRVARPAVQMQFHCLGYSLADHKFRPLAFGSQSIYWGLQFSYPQLYQDLKIHEVFTVTDSPDFPNTALFRHLQKWMRQHTIPTPFLVDGRKINVPMRLGKHCLPWINKHPQFPKFNVSVAT